MASSQSLKAMRPLDQPGITETIGKHTFLCFVSWLVISSRICYSNGKLINNPATDSVKTWLCRTRSYLFLFVTHILFLAVQLGFLPLESVRAGHPVGLLGAQHCLVEHSTLQNSVFSRNVWLGNLCILWGFGDSIQLNSQMHVIVQRGKQQHYYL